MAFPFFPLLVLAPAPKSKYAVAKKKKKKNVLDILIRVADAVVGTVNKPAITHQESNCRKRKPVKPQKKTPPETLTCFLVLHVSKILR